MTNQIGFSEWAVLLETLSSDPDSLNKEITVTEIHPILSWRNTGARVKFCTAIKDKLKSDITVSQVAKEENKYKIKFEDNQWSKLVDIAKYLLEKYELHDSWEDRYNNFLEDYKIEKSTTKRNKKTENIKIITNIDFASNSATPSPSVSHGAVGVVEKASYKRSKKRPPEPLNELPPKKQKSNQHSVLIRIDGTTSHFSEKTLKDGQGICLNDKGEICVLDNGNGICFYDEHLTNLQNDMMPDCLINDSGTGLFFGMNQFIFYVPTYQNLYTCKKEGENVFVCRFRENVSNVVSVRFHCDFAYVLSSNYFGIRISNNLGISVLCKSQNVSFSDFIVIGKSTFLILDSLHGVIYKYCSSDGSLETVNINTTLENPQGICLYVGNTILVSQADKQVITQFKFTSNNDLEIFREFSTKDYQPNKLISKNYFIYATTFKQPLTKTQPDEPVSSHVDPNQSFDEVDGETNFYSDVSFLDQLLSPDTSQPGSDSNLPQQTFLKNSLSSNILTSHLLTHSSDTQNKHKLLREFIAKFVYKLSVNQIHSIKRFRIFDIFEFLINFQFIWHNSNSNTHFGVYLSPKKRKSIGLIVFIESDLTFSFTPSDEVFTIGVICESDNSDETDESLISTFGSTLVQVFLPSNQRTIDERGMFVVISSDSSRETEGVGEIISFGELITRKANSLHLVGVCNLNKLSLVLYSDHMGKERISFPIDENVKDPICFVSITLFSMSDSLLDLFVAQLTTNLNSSQEVIPPLQLVTPKPLLHL